MCNHRSMALPSHKVLSQLACDDPQAFETLRSELIENRISRAPTRIQPRLRGIQFRVDAIRQLSRSPLGALVKIQALMWDSFLRMDQELQNFARLSNDPARHERERLSVKNYRPARSACIIELRSRLPVRTG